MYIHRVILKDVPGIPDRDLTFFDEWTGQPLQNVLLTGPNGTGKTTMLRVIAGLWNKFAQWLRYPNVPGQLSDTMDVLHDIQLAAIEIHGLIDRPLWVYEAWQDYENQKVFIEQKARQSNGLVIGGKLGALISGVEYVTTDWFKNLANLAERLQIGAGSLDEMLPNIVYLESETRQIIEPRTFGSAIQPESLYQWLVTYKSAEQFDSSLEGRLRNLKVRDPKWFEQTLEHVNAFLSQNGKRLSDFSRTEQRIIVQPVNTNGNNRPYFVQKLSSGEQQCLILIFMVSRWLMDGGVVLIDEPDLHMHVSWQRALIHELEMLVAQKKGQLIVTSHSPTLWEDYNKRQRFNLEVQLQP